MSNKNEILRAIRSNQLDPQPLPALNRADCIHYDDPLDQFCQMLRAVGGHHIRAHRRELADALDTIDAFRTAHHTCSLIESVPGNVELSSIDDPHQLETLDFCVARGVFGVAENGAVWVTDESVQHRVVYFIAQHVALVLPGQQVVHNMHEAYDRLQFSQPGFGAFISGPSKTADIEQSLVIGAHGARSLTVVLIDDD
ncbi:MAG: LUD domain-containing protein [Proteobacteria bacterium]|nr:LUD domain-containing protein [Pseudomonadota bacterium]